MPLIRNKARRAMSGLGHRRLPSATIIRVVKIKPSTTEWPIRVKLKSIDCRTTKYTALSYAHEPDVGTLRRGESSEDSSAQVHLQGDDGQTILCDGRPIQISQALWDVLDQLCRMNSDIPIWIDRLCVNFESREERASHVNMMSHIYSNASHVIVWLGKKTKATDDTILCMRKLVNAIDWQRIPHNFAADFRDPNTYVALGMDRLSIKQWNNIYNFCHATWFSRLWAFYELASAKQAVFLIGNTYMDYDFLMDFAMVLGLTGWLEDLSEMASDGYDEDSVGLTKMLGPVATLRTVPMWHPWHTDHVKWMHNEYGLSTEEQRAWKFLELLMRTSERFECQDPRDRVFAPLAYVKKVFAGKPINQAWPIVDYGTSAEVVSSHFANKIQKHTHERSILAANDQQVQQYTAKPRITPSRYRQKIPLD